MSKQSKLVIWDFDGVISDTEHLWIKNWQTLLNKKFGINWDFDTANKYLGGLSPKTKINNLQKLGFNIDDEFLAELQILDWEAMDRIEPVSGVEKVFELPNFAKCIATGGNLDKTQKKLEVLGFNKYFPENAIFTAQQVEYGKPEPDLFLFACQQMGYTPENSIVIEDSLAGLTASLRAKMVTIAYLGCPMNNNHENIQKVKDLGITNIFFNMEDVSNFLLYLK